MIHMLSKFDLKPETNIEGFAEQYSNFIRELLSLGLIQSAGPIGKRMKDTPMDTAGDVQPEFYTIMSFENRNQLDRSYEYFLSVDASNPEQAAHHALRKMTENQEFICWQDES